MEWVEKGFLRVEGRPFEGWGKEKEEKRREKKSKSR
jgi:hypothetical protein